MAHDIIHKPSKRKTKNPKSRKRKYTSNNARQKRKHIKKTKRNRKPFVNMKKYDVAIIGSSPRLKLSTRHLQGTSAT